MQMSETLKIALAAVWEASRCCERIRLDMRADDCQRKTDQSPVTVADYASQALILHRLRLATPDIPVVAEEGGEALRGDPEMLARIHHFTRTCQPDLNADRLPDLLDRGGHAGGDGRFWTLDPIDGTKGFLRGEQYAVALALVEKGRPVLGVLGCPRYVFENAPAGVVFSGGDGLPAQAWTNETGAPRSIQVCAEIDPAEARLCESVESGHTAHDQSALLIRDLGISSEVLRMDSQAKYAAVAHGAAALYLRLPVKKGYREKIWDHAAGCAVITAAGGKVTDLNGRELDFARGDTLSGNRGVIASNRKLHHAALATVIAHTPEASRWE